MSLLVNGNIVEGAMGKLSQARVDAETAAVSDTSLFMAGLPLPNSIESVAGLGAKTLSPSSVSTSTRVLDRAAGKRGLSEMSSCEGRPNKRVRTNASVTIRHVSLPAPEIHGGVTSRPHQTAGALQLHTQILDPSQDIIVIDDDADNSGTEHTNTPLQRRCNSEPAMLHAAQEFDHEGQGLQARTASENRISHPRVPESTSNADQDDEIQVISSRTLPSNDSNARASTVRESELAVLRLRLAEKRAEKEELSLLRQLAEAELQAKTK